MNATAGTAPYVGADAGSTDAANSAPLRLKEGTLKSVTNRLPEEPLLAQLSDEQTIALTRYLTSRLAAGDVRRKKRVTRFGAIDRAISTWQKLNPEDSQREINEDNSGKAQAIPFNLPILSTHLDDFVSYFAEAIAPIANPFYANNGTEVPAALVAKMDRDAIRRDYFSQVSLMLRSAVKYNVGGLRVRWHEALKSTSAIAESGNGWKSLCMYNTLWDPSIRRPQDVATKAEWAATVELTNRITLMRKALAGEWYGLDGILEECSTPEASTRLYCEPPVEAKISEDGVDSKTTSAKNGNVNWDAYGLGIASAHGSNVGGYEYVEMYCWLIPWQFGLLTDAERAELKTQEVEPSSFLELWRFELVAGKIVAAEPAIPREDHLGNETNEIPYYMTYMKQDQMAEAQRSFMELMKGFQRFASNMYNIYVSGQRKNVYGVIGYDPTAVDVTGLKNGDPVGLLPMKMPNRDVRTAITGLSTGVDMGPALASVSQTLALKDQMFPSQAMPNQVAGIDRAIKSQVATVVQGWSRPMRTILRMLDSTLLLPTRLEAFRNLKRHDKQGIESLSDEAVAKMVGAGIESMEAERIAEALWQLLYTIIQNQESIQTFNVPLILTYLGRIAKLGVDLGSFVRQQPAQVTPPAPQA